MTKVCTDIRILQVSFLILISYFCFTHKSYIILRMYINKEVSMKISVDTYQGLIGASVLFHLPPFKVSSTV